MASPSSATEMNTPRLKLRLERAEKSKDQPLDALP